MVYAVDSSLTPQFDDLGTLCHSHVIQALLVGVLTSHPKLCPRFREFRSAVSSGMTYEPNIAVSSGEEFIQQLAESTGASHLPPQVLGNHVELWQQDVGERYGDTPSPQVLLNLLARFIETCFPRTLDEWFALALQANDSEDTKQVINEVTKRVVRALSASIEAHAVAVDLSDIQRDSPELAFAIAMMILSDFLAWNTTARPTLGEVADFARLHGVTLLMDDDRQRMQLSTMLQSHSIYSGKLKSRIRRENPFAHVIRHKLASPTEPILLLPEVDTSGQLVAIRISEPESPPSTSSTLDWERQKGPRHAAVSKTETIATTSLQDQKPEECKPQARSRSAEATPERVELVRNALAKRRKSHGAEPTVRSIRSEVSMSPQTIQKCLDELRTTGEYLTPKRKRGADRAQRKETRAK